MKLEKIVAITAALAIACSSSSSLRTVSVEEAIKKDYGHCVALFVIEKRNVDLVFENPDNIYLGIYGRKHLACFYEGKYEFIKMED